MPHGVSSDRPQAHEGLLPCILVEDDIPRSRLRRELIPEMIDHRKRADRIWHRNDLHFRTKLVQRLFRIEDRQFVLERCVGERQVR
jgi:hypothetical protein